MKFDRFFVLIFVLAVFSRLLLYSNLPFGWDDSVYIMNAKFYLGDRTYFEVFRPPLISTLLSVFFVFFGTGEVVIRLFPLIISAYSIIFTYILCKRFFGRKVAIFATLFLIGTPLHIEWSSVVHTEILSSVFILLSLYFYMRWIREDRWLYISMFFCAAAGMTRFTANILFVTYIIFTLFLKRERIKEPQYAFAIIVFVYISSVWLLWSYDQTGDYFYGYRENFFWASGASDIRPVEPLFFLINSMGIFSFAMFFVIAGMVFMVKDWKRSDYAILLLLIVIFMGFHEIFNYKESRFLLPIIPVFMIAAGLGLNEIEKRSGIVKKLTLIVLCAIILIGFLQGFNAQVELCSRQALVESSLYLKQQDYGKVMSMFWPITAQYSGYPAKAFSDKPEELEYFIEKYNISYIAVSDSYGWPEYAKNFTFFEKDYLQYLGTFEDECEAVALYKVI